MGMQHRWVDISNFKTNKITQLTLSCQCQLLNYWLMLMGIDELTLTFQTSKLTTHNSTHTDCWLSCQCQLSTLSHLKFEYSRMLSDIYHFYQFLSIFITFWYLSIKMVQNDEKSKPCSLHENIQNKASLWTLFKTFQ